MFLRLRKERSEQPSCTSRDGVPVRLLQNRSCRLPIVRGVPSWIVFWKGLALLELRVNRNLLMWDSLKSLARCRIASLTWLRPPTVAPVLTSCHDVFNVKLVLTGRSLFVDSIRDSGLGASACILADCRLSLASHDYGLMYSVVALWHVVADTACSSSSLDCVHELFFNWFTVKVVVCELDMLHFRMHLLLGFAEQCVQGIIARMCIRTRVLLFPAIITHLLLMVTATVVYHWSSTGYSIFMVRRIVCWAHIIIIVQTLQTTPSTCGSHVSNVLQQLRFIRCVHVGLVLVLLSGRSYDGNGRLCHKHGRFRGLVGVLLILLGRLRIELIFMKLHIHLYTKY